MALKPMMPSITLNGAENLCEADQEVFGLLRATLQRVAAHQNVDRVTIFCDARNSDGWLEFLTVINYRDTGKLTLGCIQRKPGGEFEFHS